MCFKNDCEKEMIRKTYSVLDPLPDDAGHLVSVDVDDWVGDLDLLEGGKSSLLH